MTKKSAGLFIYKTSGDSAPEVLLVHSGGPFWGKKDLGAWSIPKGEIEEGEDFLETAKREVEEEIGIRVENGFIEIGSVKQKGGKEVFAWAVKADLDLTQFKSNVHTMEFPPKSGKMIEFPEIDKAEYFSFDVAREKMNPAQTEFLKIIN